MKRFLIVLAAVVVASWCLPAAARQPGFVRDVFERINAQRTRHQLGHIGYDMKLEKAAQAHAEWMARQRRMEHLQQPPGRFEEHRTTNHHPINRAINAGPPATQPRTVVEGWMNSPGHRKEILTGRYREMGIGVATNGNDSSGVSYSAACAISRVPGRSWR